MNGVAYRLPKKFPLTSAKVYCIFAGTIFHLYGRNNIGNNDMADIARLPGPVLDHWEWQLNAACRGMAITTFYHPWAERDQARKDRIAAAKAICRDCPAINKCRDHALRVREPYGIWGGLSEEDRARILGVYSLRYPARIPIGPQRPDENSSNRGIKQSRMTTEISPPTPPTDKGGGAVIRFPSGPPNPGTRSRSNVTPHATRSAHIPMESTP